MAHEKARMVVPCFHLLCKQRNAPRGCALERKEDVASDRSRRESPQADSYLNLISGCGGIGRHARFRFWWATVQVQVLSPAVRRRTLGMCPGSFFLLRVETLNQRFKVVSVSLRSAQNQGPPDLVGRLRLGPRSTNVHWTFCGLRSATVGLGPTSTGRCGPCHPQVERLNLRFKVSAWTYSLELSEEDCFL